MIEEIEKIIERFEKTEVNQHAHLEEIIKFNYTNITHELKSIKDNQKELFQGFKHNSENLIKLSEKQKSTQGELTDLKASERDYGINNSKKFENIFKQLDSLKYIHFKLLGMGAALMSLAGLIYKIVK